MVDIPPVLPSRYVVKSLLGSGGIAAVWLVEDLAAKTLVAFKALFPHLRRDELVVERFRREVAAVRRIQHPSVIAIHDLLDTADVLGLVMEYHPGSDLKDALRRRGPLPVDEIQSVGAQVLDGLEAAHRVGVVHRDIKPHNLLRSDDGIVKIADFGVSRVDDLVRVTTHTMTLGTPQYMPPEALTSAIVDGRADLYSLGVTLFELATGKLPFRASSPLALMRLHEEHRVPDPRALRPELPPWLGKLITRAMAKDVDARFGTAAEMREALRSKMSAPATGSGGTTRCRGCGASLVPGVPSCVECGVELVVLVSVPWLGKRVMVSGSRRAEGSILGARQPTFEQKTRLVEMLRELGGEVPILERVVDEKLRHLPAVVAELGGDDARILVDELRKEGLEVELGERGFLDELLFLVRSGGWTRVIGKAPLLAFAGWLTAVIVGVRDPFSLLMVAVGVPAAYVARAVRRNARERAQPLAKFSGQAGRVTTSDGVARQVTDTLREIKSPRLRYVVKRIAGLVVGLRVQLGRGASLRAGLAGEADHALALALATAKTAARLHERMAGVDAGRLNDELTAVDERLAGATTADETRGLIEAKTAIKERLAQADEEHHALLRLQGVLLDASRRLSELDVQVRARTNLGPDDVISVSVILRELNEELDASHAGT
jgi:hypothetical protein